MAKMARRPRTPAVLRTAAAPASTVSVALESIPPTTGTAPEMAILVTFTAAASAVPLMTPVMAM